MEHRLDLRNKIQFIVTIHDATGLLGNFTVENISEGGMCILDPQEKLVAGDFVSVTIPVPGARTVRDENGSQEAHCVMDGLVIHRHDQRVGVMWASLSLDCQRILPQLLAA